MTAEQMQMQMQMMQMQIYADAGEKNNTVV